MSPVPIRSTRQSVVVLGEHEIRALILVRPKGVASAFVHAQACLCCAESRSSCHDRVHAACACMFRGKGFRVTDSNFSNKGRNKKMVYIVPRTGRLNTRERTILENTTVRWPEQTRHLVYASTTATQAQSDTGRFYCLGTSCPHPRRALPTGHTRLRRRSLCTDRFAA